MSNSNDSTEGWIRVEYKKNKPTLITEPKNTETARKNKRRNEKKKENRILKAEEEAKRNAIYIPPHRRNKTSN